jgi:hypothetical protein
LARADHDASSPETDEEVGYHSAEDVVSLEAVKDRLMAMAKKENPALHHSLVAAELIGRAPDSLHFAASSPFHVKRLEDRVDDLADLARQFFGKPMKLKFSQSESSSDRATRAPSSLEAREAERKLKHAALNHPAVNLALRELQGEIIEIRPVAGAGGESR